MDEDSVVAMEDGGDGHNPGDGEGPVRPSQDGGDASRDESAYAENRRQPAREDHPAVHRDPHQPHHQQDPHQPHHQRDPHQPDNLDPQQPDGPEDRGPPESSDLNVPVAGQARIRKMKKCTYECPDCGKMYGQLGYLLNHQRVHRQASKSLVLELEQLKKKSFQCETCGRSYSRASALDAHRRCHEGKLIKGRYNKGARDAAHAEESVGDNVHTEGPPGDTSAGETVYIEGPAAGDKGAGHADLAEGPVEDKGAGDTVHTEGLSVGNDVLTKQPVGAKSVGDTVPTEGPVGDKGTGRAVHTDGANEKSKNQTGGAPTGNSFTCTCGKSFSALSRLKTHQRFSRNVQCTPEQPKATPPKKAFQCAECNKTFGGHIALINHQRWHANRSADVGTKFPCEECGKVFMTLTFYYKHQRLAHSEETAAKSFLNQVCQLQKKAFECQDCGLKFSRASAFQSHQLHHTDVFKGDDKEPPLPARPVAQEKPSQCDKEETPHVSELVRDSRDASYTVTSVSQDSCEIVDVEGVEDDEEEDEEGYETADFHVEVISASESEEEEEDAQDLNPDLELLCESDQENAVSVSTFASKPGGVDLNIVQIDFEADDDRGERPESDATKAERKAAHPDRFHCPECPRWFSSPSSLRVHRLWHGVLKNKLSRRDPGKPKRIYTCDACGHETYNRVTHCNHIQRHKYLKEAAGQEKDLKCDDCGKDFSSVSAWISHQMQHHAKRKAFPCPDCVTSFSRATGLHNHQKHCPGKNNNNTGEDGGSAIKKEFNPTKTLLGPKIFHCEQCGKGFWSLGAYSHHKQSPNQCADLRQSNGVSAVNGHSRSSHAAGRKVACPVCGRKFRHKGIMKSHMRKHEDGDHKCELCGRSFRLFSSMLRHQTVHRTRVLPPPIKSFQHQVEQVQKNTYSCPDCGKLFSRAKALQFHMRSHGYETSYSPSSPRSAVTLEELQCPTCLAHFNRKSSLRAHQKLCVKREPDAQAASGTTVAENMVTDVKTEQQTSDDAENASSARLKYKCKECPRSFSVSGALNFHKRIHRQGHNSKAKSKLALSAVFQKSKQGDQTVGSFLCSECGRRFATNSALGTHKRWHTDKKFAVSLVKGGEWKYDSNPTASEVPYQCQNCGKGFFYLCVLRRHQIFCAPPPGQTKAAEAQPDKADKSAEEEGGGGGGGTKLPCPECNKTFSRGSSLAVHYESEHCGTLKSTDHPPREPSRVTSADRAPEQPDATDATSEAAPSIVQGRVQCPLCLMTFAKLRGLRAHKWQAHSTGSKNKSKSTVATRDNVATSGHDDVKQTQGVTVVTDDAVTPVSKRKRRKRRINAKTWGAFPCPRCGKKYSSPGALYNHKKACLQLKQEPDQEPTPYREPTPKQEVTPKRGPAHKQGPKSPKQQQQQELPAVKQEPPPREIQLPETAAAAAATHEVLVSPSRPPSEHSVKYLFKCGKCGKAFQTEEQLAAHKAQGRSRPYCCALCCHGYWTEAQLQQHLVWHDEVRRRLPIELRYRLYGLAASRPPKSPSVVPSKDDPRPVSPKLGSLAGRPPQATSHKCQHCGKSFLSPTALAKHEAQHGTGDDSDGDGDTYTCPYCPRTFGDIQDLIVHHQKCVGEFRGQPAGVTASGHAAGGDGGLTCHECGASFGLETELHRHYMEHARGSC